MSVLKQLLNDFYQCIGIVLTHELVEGNYTKKLQQSLTLFTVCKYYHPHFICLGF